MSKKTVSRKSRRNRAVDMFKTEVAGPLRGSDGFLVHVRWPNCNAHKDSWGPNKNVLKQPCAWYWDHSKIASVSLQEERKFSSNNREVPWWWTYKSKSGRREHSYRKREGDTRSVKKFVWMCGIESTTDISWSILSYSKQDPPIQGRASFASHKSFQLYSSSLWAF